MNACERLNRIVPFHFVAIRFEHLPLSLLQNRKWLHDSVAQNCEEFRRALLRRFQNVARELSIVRTLLDNHEIVDLPEPLPDFGKLRGQESSEERADTHVREVIAVPSDRTPPTGIISVLGMIERLLHEPGK